MAGYGECWEKDQYIQGESEEVQKEAEKEKQEGIQGQWQHDSLAKDHLEQVKCCKNTGVCLRTASVEWNVPGKYGPHGELFYFLIKKELATMPLAPSSRLTSAKREGVERVDVKLLERHVDIWLPKESNVGK